MLFLQRTVKKKLRILGVDDEPVIGESIAFALEGPNRKVVVAKDGQEALALASKEKFDVVITDHRMPRAGGLELVKNLEQRFPLVALIVLSMHDEALYAERALRAGAKGYVMKRETSKNVLTAIRRVLAGDVYVSERVVSAMARRMGSSRKAAAEPVERLSNRELEIFRLLGQGRTTSQIAEDLHLSLKTVQAYCARAKEKFGVNSLGELLRAAIRWEDATHVK